MKPQVEIADEIRLSCRNVWKVYGADPQKFFKAENGKQSEPSILANKIVDSGHILAACDVSFDVHVGEIFVIMGLSGSGKSTVVRCLSRLVEPNVGEVLLDGEDLLKKTDSQLTEIRRHKMGMVFQNFGLMPHLNVLENIAFPLKLQGISEAERNKQAARVIELVGLVGREFNFPKELSGGQQQRVGIARSLAVEPDVWFLDEPFSALDPLIRKQMQNEFLRIQALKKKSVIFITHDFQEALRIADRMAIMRDGGIVQVGRPVDLILNPSDDYIRDFTYDVPWESVLSAADIVTQLPSSTDNLPTVSGSTPVSKVLSLLAQNETGVVVTGANGAALGLATTKTFVQALATAETETRKETE